MENVTLIFKGSELSETNKVELICEINMINEISISIKDFEVEHDYNTQYISFNKQTAVRLVRELKKQIGFIESEVDFE